MTLALSEKAWQAQVVELLKLHDWMVFHPFDSRRSEPGWPDLFAIRDNRVLAIELKTTKGRVTKAQTAWLQALDGVKVVDAFVCRPAEDLSELEELVA